MIMDPLLKIENLSVGFNTDEGLVNVVENTDIHVNKGETVCILGESGSGKSVTALTVMRLTEFENGKITSGNIFFEGESLLKKSQNEMRKIRGSEIAMVFQDPMSALNPVFKIGKQISEVLLLHTNMTA